MAKALLGLAVVGGVVGVAALALAKKKDEPPPLVGPGVVMVPDGKGGWVPARVGPGGIYPAEYNAARTPPYFGPRRTRTAGAACCAACAQGAPCGSVTEEEARMHALVAATRAAGRAA